MKAYKSGAGFGGGKKLKTEAAENVHDGEDDDDEDDEEDDEDDDDDDDVE